MTFARGSTVRGSRWARISSEEEERVREGYHLTTHFWVAPGSTSQIVSVLSKTDASPLMEVNFIPQAKLWRINHGWRRAGERQGFALKQNTGIWRRREEDDANNGERPERQTGTVISGVKPYVTDNRNILLLRPLTEKASDLSFLKTLAYALQKGIQVIYQVEEQEVAVELIGQGATNVSCYGRPPKEVREFGSAYFKINKHSQRLRVRP
ncbi:MAG: hypothetical protein FJ134_15680 [Deltaproteobacteria bacterium]|nr:hypothetical protein [Deltaproteobacteria bacterium]